MISPRIEPNVAAKNTGTGKIYAPLVKKDSKLERLQAFLLTL